MAGKQAADRFGTCSSNRGESSSEPGEEVKLTSAKEETRGITKRKSGVTNIPLYIVVPAASGAQGEDSHLFPGEVEVPVDSFPENDGWWTPPLHGEDVASLCDLVVQELDNHKDDYKMFTRILEDHGCWTRSIEEDFLLCFKNEGMLRPPEMGLANLQGQMSEEAMSPMKRTIATSFRVGDKGRIIRPSIEELERCLAGTPDHDWKYTWKSLHDVAVDAVKNGEWQVASAQYEACVQVLETMQDSIAVHVQNWLLLWVYIPLVNIYHLRLGNYQRCVIVIDNMLELLISDAGLPRKQKWMEEEEDSLTPLFYSIIWHRRLVLFEWSHEFETEGNLLVSRYVRSKAFDKIMVRECMYLQQMVNYWGQRSKDREGDTRVAFCFTLQRLYTESRQHEKIVQWMKEKWRWIRDETHEPKTQWKLKLHDFRSLFRSLSLGHEVINDYAKSIMSDLEKVKSSLPPLESDTVDFWNAAFLWVSGWEKKTEEGLHRANETVERLQRLRERLEKRYGSYTYESSVEERMAKQLMSLVKVVISSLFSYKRSAEVLEHSPFKVEMVEWPAANDRFALSLLEEASQGVPESDSRTLRLRQAEQVMNSLEKRSPGEDIETHRDRLHEAMDYFITHIRSVPKKEDVLRHADDVIFHEKIVETQREIRREQSLFHYYLGVCYAKAHDLKPRGVAYNLQDPHSEMPVYNEHFLNMAIGHLTKALDLAETSRLANIIFCLGWIHFLKARQYQERLRTFRCLVPFFQSEYLSLDEESRIQTSIGVRPLAVAWSLQDSRESHHTYPHLYMVRLGLHNLIYSRKEKMSTEPSGAVVHFGILGVKEYRQLLGLRQEYLTDEDLARVLQELIQGRLIQDLLLEIKWSSEYFQTSREMGLGRIRRTDTSHDKDLLLLFEVENTKGLFTYYQRLMVYEQTVRQIFKEDGISVSVVTTPEAAEYLRSQTNDLTPSQRALIYAERGRSRGLIHQSLKNRLPEELVDNLVKVDETDQEVWAKLRKTQLECGENTVFVEYTFDTTHSLLGTSKSNYDWKWCRWIVYIVMGEGEVHMRSYVSEVPEILVARIHELFSMGKEDAEVDRSLEQLYDEFIEPISVLLTDMKPENHLIFVLDEVLTNVPFAILRNPQTGEYLFQNHTISFTPAFRVLSHCLQKHKSLQRSPTLEPSIALGNPSYPPGSLRELPYTSDEVMSIALLFSDDYVRTLTRTEATVENLLMLAKSTPDKVQGFVHVAAHGFVDQNHKSGSLQLSYSNADSEQNPSSSSSRTNRDTNDEDEAEDLDELMGTLAVDPDVRSGKERPSSRKTKRAKEAMAKEKACLSSQKIMQCGFEWRTHMVVLSACNSAKGIILGSEGVMGLPRAFIATGVPCIVASQWSLEDKSSSELMGEFYKEMSRGRDAATALRTAMLCRMRPDHVGSSNGHAPVYKWGGYLVWGCPTVTLPPSMLKQ